jgi:hypothetical protein
MPVLRSLANVGQDPKMAMRLVQALIESTATPQTNTLPAPAQDKLMNGEDLAQATARAMSTGTVAQNRMPPPAAPPMAAELMSPEEFGSRTGTITGGDTRNMLRGEMPLAPGDLRGLLSVARRISRKPPSAKPPEQFPKAEEMVGGLEVRSDIPNTSSISGTFDDFEVLPGVRKVDISDWNKKSFFVTVDDHDRVRKLAEEIRQSGEINPLIVAVDASGEPWIMEGVHRLEALQKLGVNEIPALVVKEVR